MSTYATGYEKLAALTVGPDQRVQIVNTWNGGAGGRKIEFVSGGTGEQGINECLEWLHRHTPFSWSSAINDQGYSLEAV